MKKLLISPLILLLTACVSYYYPQTALEDGVYYAEDDPAYDNYTYSYAGASYYPWHSLDYFYLGYSPYVGYGNGPYGYGGFSIGLSYGYSPWYPYYGYSTPWYGSHYGYAYHPGWRPYYNHGHHYYSNHRYSSHRYNKKKHKKKHKKKSHQSGKHDRYAGSNRGSGKNRNRDDRIRNRNSGDRGAVNRQANGDRSSRVNNQQVDISKMYRSASTPQPGVPVQLNRQAKNPQAKNIGRQRPQPVYSSRLQSVSVPPSVDGRALSDKRSRWVSRERGSGAVRYRSDAGQQLSRGGTGEYNPASGRTPVTGAPSQPVVYQGNSGRNSRPAPVRSTREPSGRPSSRSVSRGPSSSGVRTSSNRSARKHASSSNSTRVASKRGFSGDSRGRDRR